MAQAAPKATFSQVANIANLIAPVLPYTPNLRSTIALPSTGYLARTRFMVNLTITTGAGAAGTLVGGAYPGPFSLIRGIGLRNQNGTYFYNTSGQDNYLFNRWQRQHDIRNLPTVNSSTSTQALLYAAPATIAASSTYIVRFPIEIDSILSEGDMMGLILLEGRGTIYLDVDFNDATLSGVVYSMSAGAITSATATIVPEIETFLVPSDPTIAPDQTMMHVVQSYTDAWSVTGTDVYTPLYGGTLLRAMIYYIDTTGNRVDPLYLTNYRAKFGGINLNESGTVQQLLEKMGRQGWGKTMPDGVMVHDYLAGRGDSSRLPSMRDAVTLRNAADFTLETDIAPSCPNTGAGGKRVVILETLRRVATA